MTAPLPAPGAPIPPGELEAFLDEALPAARMAQIEEALRTQPALQHAAAAIVGRRDAGLHSLGAIWRRARLTCPSREQLGSYLLGVLAPAHESYVQFHLETIGCRYCQASLIDLKEQAAGAHQGSSQRQRRYFQSSAGWLPPDEGGS